MAAACSLPHFMNMQVVMNSTAAMRMQPVMTPHTSLASCNGPYESPQTQEGAQPGHKLL